VRAVCPRWAPPPARSRRGPRPRWAEATRRWLWPVAARRLPACVTRPTLGAARVACAPAAAAGTLALIAGGAYALTKVDEGFEEFMDEASCKVRARGGGSARKRRCRARRECACVACSTLSTHACSGLRARTPLMCGCGFGCCCALPAGLWR
jgi:hypothetical protein